jgi:hypothetical protein
MIENLVLVLPVITAVAGPFGVFFFARWVDKYVGLWKSLAIRRELLGSRGDKNGD